MEKEVKKNILSIDLESWIYFYEHALKSDISYCEKKAMDDNHIPNATSDILDLMDKYNQKATFFVLGELYEWYPKTIESIEKRGHEIAYHTHSHRLLSNKYILERELEKSKDFIDRFKPIGFRAPQIYITPDLMASLKKRNFKYSSSTYNEHKISNIDGIDEIPVSSIYFRKNDNNDFPKNLNVSLIFRAIPFGSGLFISLIRSKISYFINYCNNKNVPAVLFIHPWQLYMSKEIKGFSFKFKTLYRTPLSFPYTFNILKPVETLLKKHKFTSFKEYYYE